MLLQQILETIGQITKKMLDKNLQQVMKLKPLILELYRQLMHFLFNLEAKESAKDWADLNPTRSLIVGNQTLERYLENP